MFRWKRRKDFWKVKIKSTESRNFFAHSLKMFKEPVFFFKRIFLFKLFLWTCRLQFWQPYWKICYRRPGVFTASFSKKDGGIFLSTKVLPKMFLWHVKCSFDYPVKRHVPEGRKLSAQSRTLLEQDNSFKKTVFPEIVPKET